MHCRLGASARKATAVAVNPDLSTATAAVHRSAASLGATLTPGDIAMERAGGAAARLDAYLVAKVQRQHLNPASFHGGGGKYD